MDAQEEEPLQAVILADAFANVSRYGPLVRGGGKHEGSNESALPWCLLPFLNAPLIAWTLESLAASNVQQTYVIIKDGPTQVQEWLEQSTFGNASITSSMKVALRSTLGNSEGDVLRDVDDLGLKADFLLVRAGYIGNIDLESAVRAFTVKRKKDSSLLMECLVAARAVVPRPKSSTHILTPSGRLLHYTHRPRYPKRRRLQFPLSLFESGEELSIRTDLESIGVDICSMELPPLFVENFDYQNLRPDFINGILTSDILMKSIRCSIIGESTGDARIATIAPRSSPYGSCVGDLSSYAQNTHAVMSRWAHPLVLDECVPGTEDRYEQRRGRKYLGRGLALAQTCSIGPSSVVGHGTSVGHQTKIDHSIIGAKCIIGNNVTIRQSFVYDRVSIEDGAIIENSIVGQETFVQRGAKILEGCLVGPAVTVSWQTESRGLCMSAHEYDPEEPQKANGVSTPHTHIWPTEKQRNDDDYDSDDDEKPDPRNLGMSELHRPTDRCYDSVSTSSVSNFSESSEGSDSDNDDGDSDESDDMSAAAEPRISGIGLLDMSGENTAFLQECTYTLERAFKEDHTVSNTVIELKTLRMSSNVTLTQVVGVVIPFLCEKADLPADASADTLRDKVEGVIERWGQAITLLDGGQTRGMIDAILALQQHCATKTVHSRLFLTFFSSLYNEDVISLEAAAAWLTDSQSQKTGGEAGLKLREVGKAYVQFIVNSEDSDEEDENE